MKKLPAESEIKELKRILDSIASNFKNTLAQCINAGELLTKIKAKTKYGDWEEVLESVDLTFKTAQRYMQFWEHRAELNLKEIKTLVDAENSIARIGRIPIPTSQNEPLTHEKTSTFALEKRSCLTESATIHREQREWQLDGTEIPKAMPEDRALAKDFSRVYPKQFTVEVMNEAEEEKLRAFLDSLWSGRGTNDKPKTTRDLIAALRNAYKETTGKNLLVTGPDAGQCRRLLEAAGPGEIPEIVDVFKKAVKSSGFFARQSHQLLTFIKHYGNIRNEVSGRVNGSVNPRNDGLFENKTDYAAVVARKSGMVRPLATAANRSPSSTPAP